MAELNTLHVSGVASGDSPPSSSNHFVRAGDLREFIPAASRPTSFTSAGLAGQWTCDGVYLYFCYADSQWGFVPLQRTTFPTDQPTL